MMTFDNVVTALIAKFGENTIVRTKDALEHIEALGLRSGDYYIDMRETYGIARGKLCFGTAPSDDNDNDDFIADVVEVETDEQIEQRINERFEALDIMARATAKGINRCLLLSGPAGVGKSHGVESAAQEICGDFAHIKGYVRATGLYKTLYKNRNAGNLVVLDDADSIFEDSTCLNLLKAACDSSDVRKLSWLSNAEMEDEDGESIPNNFIFNGSIIFITNIDFAAASEKGSKLSPHFEALLSRAHYLSLDIKNKRDYIIRIKQVLKGGMLDDILTMDEKMEVVAFMEENANKMRELSLRMAKKLADLMLMDKNSWKKLARMTCMR